MKITNACSLSAQRHGSRSSRSGLMMLVIIVHLMIRNTLACLGSIKRPICAQQGLQAVRNEHTAWQEEFRRFGRARF